MGFVDYCYEKHDQPVSTDTWKRIAEEWPLEKVERLIEEKEAAAKRVHRRGNSAPSLVRELNYLYKIRDRMRTIEFPSLEKYQLD